LVVSLSSSAWALDAAVGRVLHVDRTAGSTVEVELETVNGSFFSNDDLELFTPAGKVGAKLKLPPTIDMLMKGDKVKVTLELARPFSADGGLLAPKGTFDNHAALARTLGSGPPPSPSPSSPAPPRITVPSCPFTPAELKGALGLAYSDGSASPDVPFVGGVMKSCQYRGADLKTPGLTVTLTVMNDPTQTTGWRSRLAGKTTPVPGDADGALWQVDQGDLTNPTLHYVRNGVIAQLRLGVGPKDPRFTAWQQKLARVRRVP